MKFNTQEHAFTHKIPPSLSLSQHLSSIFDELLHWLTHIYQKKKPISLSLQFFFFFHSISSYFSPRTSFSIIFSFCASIPVSFCLSLLPTLLLLFHLYPPTPPSPIVSACGAVLCCVMSSWQTWWKQLFNCVLLTSLLALNERGEAWEAIGV